jgi:hypothetical protein
MATIQFPEVVFSTNVYTEPTWSMNRYVYWSSNGSGSYGAGNGTFDQVPHLMASTTVDRASLLDPSTNTFVSADSTSFQTATQNAIKALSPNSSSDGYVVYGFDAGQDHPIELPSVAPVSQGQVRINVAVTARARRGSSRIWAFLREGHVVYGENLAWDLQEPYQPWLTPEWTTHNINLNYDTPGYDFWPITNGEFPDIYHKMRDGLARGKAYFHLTFTDQDNLLVDIAHVKFSGSISWVGTLIDPGNLDTRARFGRS